MFRYSTLKKLLEFQTGTQPLSESMRISMSNDPLNPVLSDQMLLALDRRVNITLKHVHECIRTKGSHEVIIDDGR